MRKIRIDSSKKADMYRMKLENGNSENESSSHIFYAEHYRIEGIQYYNQKKALYNKIINMFTENNSNRSELHGWIDPSAQEELDQSRQMAEYHMQLASINNMENNK